MNHDPLLIKIVQRHGITRLIGCTTHPDLVVLDGCRIKNFIKPVGSFLIGSSDQVFGRNAVLAFIHGSNGAHWKDVVRNSWRRNGTSKHRNVGIYNFGRVRNFSIDK